MSTNYQVSKRDNGTWVVMKEGGARASSLHGTKRAAIDTARKLANINNGKLTLHDSSDSTQRTSAASAPAAQAKASTPKEQSLAQRIGGRISRARAMRGLSLRDLAEQLNDLVSHTTLQKFEKGVTNPDSRILSALARTLAVRPDYFFQEDKLRVQQIEYRKLGKLGRKHQKQLEEQAFEFFERYCEIESIMELPLTQLPYFDLRATGLEKVEEEVEKAANQIRQEWELGRNPIPDVHLMLENHGVKVKMLSAEDGFDGFSSRVAVGKHLMGTIALSKGLKSDLPRLRLTALHELAHLVIDFPEAVEHRAMENLCHRFGAALLIPQDIFEAIFGQNRTRIATAELKAIKTEWGISFGATMARAKDLGLISPSRYKSFCFLSRKWNWHRKEPGEWFGNETSNRFEPLVLRALAEERISTSKAAGLLNISLPELGEKFDLID